MAWIKKYWKIVGLMAIVGYMSVIIGVWMYADLSGYTYFRGGEPLWYVKWFEWFMGAVGILTAVHYLKLELRVSD